MPTKSKPPRASELIVNRYLALAEAGNADALSQAHTYMAANGSHDWSDQLERIDGPGAESLTSGSLLFEPPTPEQAQAATVAHAGELAHELERTRADLEALEPTAIYLR